MISVMENGSRDFCGRRFDFSALSEDSASNFSRSTKFLKGRRSIPFLSHVPLEPPLSLLFSFVMGYLGHSTSDFSSFY